MVEEAGTVKCKTTKEIKAMARPEFEANPEKFYPTKVFAEMGYSRAKCPVSGTYFWRHTDKKVTCGDSSVDGKYSFIGPGNGLSKNGKKYTYAECW
jgi:alanyl-tRNA synthetase